ncbi:prepilin peptidase [Streptomyces sp. AK04-3B]|uniref:prepilin peptidase n=1 Tax=Streptomyces sp. AK04-3B TaxID=3028650 RepID=UPI0029BF097F|nr:prepilin peptidase [Streptomyces sp. AK04-3B]MDX3801920.1 prepilin peptidase [Streptomyces sp. AK04-3B]
MTTPPSDLTLTAAAALWGAVTGALLPRAAYRFSVPPEEEQDEQTAESDEQTTEPGEQAAAPDEQAAERDENAPERQEQTAERGTADESDEQAGQEAPGTPGAPGGTGAPGGQEEWETVGGWRAACPAGHPFRGWLGRAHCRRCAATVAPGALLLPALTALLCAALAMATGVRPESVVWLALAPVGVLLAVVDVRVRRLPDPLTLPLAVAALALLGLAALLPEHAGDWTTALLGALALGAGYLVLHLVNPGGMAFGDVKLALGMGAVLGWYGWPTVMLGTFAAFLFGALYGGVLFVVGRGRRGTLIAFGPFMLVGTLAGLLVGAYAA